MKSTYLLCLIPLFWQACHSSRSAPVAEVAEAVVDDSIELLIRLYKGSCYGQCPTYTLEVFSNGNVVITPRRFLLVDSVMTAKWPLEEILPAFEAAGLDQLDAEYMAHIADIPSYRLSYKGTEIRWNMKKPIVLQNLVAILDHYTVREGWLQSDNAFQKQPKYRREEELIVQLKPGTDQQIWLDTYQDVGLFVIRQIVPDGDYILVGYNRSVVEPENILARVRQDAQVVLASFNKELEQRD